MFSGAKVEIYYKSTKKIDNYFFGMLFFLKSVAGEWSMDDVKRDIYS